MARLFLVRGIDRRLLRRISRYITGPPSAYLVWKRVRKLNVPNATKLHPGLTTDVRFRIPLGKITTPWGFSFHPDGWHPYTATLHQWLEEGEVRLVETPLHHLYDRFRPKTVQEAILEHRRDPLEPLSSWPVDAGLLSVWSVTLQGATNALAQLPNKDPRPRQFIGPAPRGFIQADVERLIDLYESISRHGFAPERFVSPSISGYFLVYDDEYRFICRQGSHRLAVLACCGYTTVEVSLATKVAPIVSHADLSCWTVAQGGLYSDALAKELFNKMFYENGRTKARNIGILELDD